MSVIRPLVPIYLMIRIEGCLRYSGDFDVGTNDHEIVLIMLKSEEINWKWTQF